MEVHTDWSQGEAQTGPAVAKQLGTRRISEIGLDEEACNFQESNFVGAQSFVAPLPSQSHELNQLLVDIQSQVTVAAVRHEELLRHLIGELREDLSRMQSATKEDAVVRQLSFLPACLPSEGKSANVPKTDVTPQSENFQREADDSLRGRSANVSKTDTISQSVRTSRVSEALSVSQATSVNQDRSTANKEKTGKKIREAVLNPRHGSQLSENVKFKTIRQRADWLLKSKEFEILISVALICNALVMCCESQYFGLQVGYELQFSDRELPANVLWQHAEEVFNVLGWIFGIIFAWEFLCKIIVWKHRYFCNRWNLLDFVCIVVFALDKFAADFDAFNPHMLRLVRLLKLGRLVRLIRFLESLEALYVMTTAIFGLSRVLGWAVFLLTLILLTCDLFLVQLLHSTYFANAVATDMEAEELRSHQIMYKYFGTVSRCLLSMFEITMGNWPVIARLLSEEVSQWFIVLCLTHKLTVGFAVMGVITGVILQETFKVAQTDDMIMLRTKKRQGKILERKLENLFKALDEDADGKLTLMEFLSITDDPDIKTWLGSLELETDDLPQLFKLCSEDTDGMLSLDEIVHRMPRIRGAARSIDLLTVLDELRYAIALCGGDGHEKQTDNGVSQSLVSIADAATGTEDLHEGPSEMVEDRLQL